VSIVFELQRAALDHQTPLTALLRQCLAVASKLDLQDSVTWVRSELNGYEPTVQIPHYRVMPARLEALNPFHGWREVMFDGDPEFGRAVATMRIPNPISELETMATGSGAVYLAVPAELAASLRQAVRVDTEFRRQMSRASAGAAIDAVRTLVLDWALTLERNGIRGEDHTFTADEKRSGSNVPVPGIVMQGNNNVVNYQGGQSQSSPQAVTTNAPQTSEHWLPRLLKALPEHGWKVVLGLVLSAAGAAFAWFKGLLSF
jgi:hypothetical protein